MLSFFHPFSNLLATFFFFFFNDTATTEIYTLSLHDALPISARAPGSASRCRSSAGAVPRCRRTRRSRSRRRGPREGVRRKAEGGTGVSHYFAVMTKCARRFCCQQPSLDSVQKGRSF